MTTPTDVTADTIATYWNVRDEYKNKTLEELKDICMKDSLPFAVCAINVTGDLNLGVMMRSACLMGAERFIIYGKHSYDRRSTVGAQNYIDVVKAGKIARDGSMEIDYSDFIPTLSSYRYAPVFFDTGGKDFHTFDPYYSVPRGKKPCLVFGNEGMGIPRELMDGHNVYTIPQRGVLRSLNVCAAASIAIAQTSTYLAEIYNTEVRSSIG